MPLFKPNIAALKAKHDVPGLVQALKTRDAQVCRDAAEALGELRAVQAVPAIAELLLADSNSLEEKMAAAGALGKIGDEVAIEPLVHAIAVSRQRETQAIDEATASDPGRRAGFYINRIASDEFEMRTAIALALGHIGSARAIQALFDILADEKGAMASSVQNSIRDAIVDAVKISLSDALPVLCNAIKHASPQVRAWAAHCLAEFNDAQAIDALLRAAYDDNENYDVREAAFASLGQVGTPRVIPFLEDLMHDGNPGIARGAQMCATSIRTRFPTKPIDAD